ncbi:unnamed protein product, partial [Leptidea sinapis]
MPMRTLFDIVARRRLPAREGLITPRSARAPIGRRATSTLPHQRLKKEKSVESPPDMDSPVGSIGSDLRRQNEELRARLAGENADHKRRLDAYRRAQQGQAALVSRLQAKVVQYKQRCADLENQMLETTPRSESYKPSSSKSIALPAPAVLSTSSSDTQRDERINDVETALRRLDEEKRNNDWEALRDEMAIKEDEWKDEEQAFNDYYSNEHNRLLSLWREVVSVKRFFSDLQTNTERDLYKAKNDIDSPDAQAAQHSQTTPSIDNLRSELHSAATQRDNALAELRERDTRIQRLLQELQGLFAEAECVFERERIRREYNLGRTRRAAQVKLQNSREQLSTSRKQCEASESKCDQANSELNQTIQEKESLQKTVESLTSDYEKLQKVNSELEIELERTLLERGDLQDVVEKLQAIIRNLECDKKKLLEDVKQLEEERSSLSNQSSEQQGDLGSLRKELLAAEQQRIELEADKAGLADKIRFLEGEREKVE